MRQMIFSSLCLIGLVTGQSSWAEPTLLYKFHTNEVTADCFSECPVSTESYRQTLDAMELGIDQQFRSTGSATYSLRVMPGSVDLSNDYLTQIKLPIYFADMPQDIPVDDRVNELESPNRYIGLDMVLKPAGNRLTGYVSLFESNNMLVMSTTPSPLFPFTPYYEDELAPTYRHEWAGTAGTDEFPEDRWFFRGEWRLSQVIQGGKVVPEPGTVPLLLGALVGVAALLGRNRRKALG